jgi:hypothetical protein
MAHRRAAPPSRTWRVWLLVPVALALDAAAALGLEGRPFPTGVRVPEAVLLAAPCLVYGTLAFVAFRARPLASRFAALAVLLGIHATLIALHTVVFMSLWSLPAPAAVRLAHRWSPLIPLLQLVWVPLLALPLGTLIDRRAPTRADRFRAAPARRAPASPRPPLPERARPEPPREVTVEPGPPVLAAAVAVEPAPSPEPEVVPSASARVVLTPMAVEATPEVSAEAPPAAPLHREPPPVPTWSAELLASPREEATSVIAEAEVVGDSPGPMEVASVPAPAEAVATPEAEAIAQAALHVVAEAPSTGDREIEVAVTPEPEAPARAAEPPLDLELVARTFGPYGALLSRDRAVSVDWTPVPAPAVVCVAPREMSRGRMVRLAGRLTETGATPTPGPIRRLSLRSHEGVLVLTPVAGGVLVAASPRRGALALLEVLSRRVAHPDGRDHTEGVEPGMVFPWSAAGPALVDLRPEPAGLPPRDDDPALRSAVRVTTPSAWVDVVAPPGTDAESLGALAGRLVGMLIDGDPAGAVDLHSLSVDLPAHRLVIRPVHPHASPPRFVTVVGGSEPPGLLGLRAERAARTLREAS